MEERREKLAAKGEVTCTAEADLELQKWRRNFCLPKVKDRQEEIRRSKNQYMEDMAVIRWYAKMS